jgi:hypothetical protein
METAPFGGGGQKVRVAGKFLFLVGWAGMLSNASWFMSLAMANVGAGRSSRVLNPDDAWFLKFFFVLWLVPICLGLAADAYMRLRKPALVPIKIRQDAGRADR